MLFGLNPGLCPCGFDTVQVIQDSAQVLCRLLDHLEVVAVAAGGAELDYPG